MEAAGASATACLPTIASLLAKRDATGEHARQAQRGILRMKEPVDIVVGALAEAQTVIIDYHERRGQSRSSHTTVERLRAILEDPAVVAAMETLGHAPMRVVARLRVIDGGASDKGE